MIGAIENKIVGFDEVDCVQRIDVVGVSYVISAWVDPGVVSSAESLGESANLTGEVAGMRFRPSPSQSSA